MVRELIKSNSVNDFGKCLKRITFRRGKVEPPVAPPAPELIFRPCQGGFLLKKEIKRERRGMLRARGLNTHSKLGNCKKITYLKFRPLLQIIFILLADPRRVAAIFLLVPQVKFRSDDVINLNLLISTSFFWRRN